MGPDPRNRTGLHESSSDPRPHITLAAATKSMRKHHQHVVVHSRLSSSRFEDAEFVGSEEFPDNVRKDDERLRNSYASPIQTRASLIIKDSESVPVGCIVTSGRVQWYFLNDEQELVYLEEDNFYRAGQGGSQHLRFWNPLVSRTCRAVFQGFERPQPRSPDPEPSNLEGAMEELTIISNEIWVTPEAVFGKNPRLVFRNNDGHKIGTSWEDWKAEGSEEAMFFVYEGKISGVRYKATELPGEWVLPWLESSSSRPIQFMNEKGHVIRTKRRRWQEGKEGCFFVYLEDAAFYLAVELPSADE
ncbi:hypothetical protein EV126DRAFT_154332 [Verticillium dahliae]|nr:hypothetical protein EV126DRAFT_154332 [Verticillium dahliae]